ncbi:MAG: hemolysin III family protein [Planctomycetes bacterium]|nr:hemolysin III family protein [Planctomycetota bacterium]
MEYPPEWDPWDERPSLRGKPDVVAFCCAVPAGIVLAANAATSLGVFASLVFAFGLSLMLGMSGLYHTINWGPERFIFLSRCDYASIYVMIGASYTPFCLCTPGFTYGKELLGAVWIGVVLGVVLTMFRPSSSRALRAALYVLLGVALLPTIPSYYQAVSREVFAMTAGGGVLYIVGACCYVAHWPNPVPKHYGHHEVFHMFVFMAAALHYAAIWTIVT